MRRTTLSLLTLGFLAIPQLGEAQQTHRREQEQSPPPRTDDAKAAATRQDCGPGSARSDVAGRDRRQFAQTSEARDRDCAPAAAGSGGPSPDQATGRDRRKQ
jgi:hypothetical protein